MDSAAICGAAVALLGPLRVTFGKTCSEHNAAEIPPKPSVVRVLGRGSITDLHLDDSRPLITSLDSSVDCGHLRSEECQRMIRVAFEAPYAEHSRLLPKSGFDLLVLQFPFVLRRLCPRNHLAQNGPRLLVPNQLDCLRSCQRPVEAGA